MNPPFPPRPKPSLHSIPLRDDGVELEPATRAAVARTVRDVLKDELKPLNESLQLQGDAVLQLLAIPSQLKSFGESINENLKATHKLADIVGEPPRPEELTKATASLLRPEQRIILQQGTGLCARVARLDAVVGTPPDASDILSANLAERASMAEKDPKAWEEAQKKALKKATGLCKQVAFLITERMKVRAVAGAGLVGGLLGSAPSWVPWVWELLQKVG